MLSSVVLVSLSSARDKGRVATGLVFSTNNYHALGADAVLYMDFNSGGAVDQSQYNFVSTVGNGASFQSGAGNTPSGQGSSIKLDGTDSDGFVQSTLVSPISIASSVSNIRFTASAWVKPDADENNGGMILVSGSSDCSWAGNRTISLQWSSNGKLNVWNNGVSTDSNLAIAPRSKWTNIAYSWNGSKYSFYIDGKFIESISPLNSGGNPGIETIKCLSIGNYFNNYNLAFKGNIDDVAIYTQSLTASAIEKIYASGLPTHIVAEAR